MSVIDILFRVDEICKKYDRFDVDKQREIHASSEDAFSHLYSSVEAEIEPTLHKARMASTEKNRASAVAMYAEIRRTKARLLGEIPKLQKLAMKKSKGVSKEEMSTRSELVLVLSERIKSIPDGASTPSIQPGAYSTSHRNIKFDSPDAQFGTDFFQSTDESSQFREEYEMRKMKQDQGLEYISDGLDTLKNLAHDMGEELDRQVPLMDEIDTKVDKATYDLKNTNARLKETLTKVRSSRNFLIDIILLCVILGIVSYLYNILN